MIYSRYTSESCSSLSPVYEDEDFSSLGVGIKEDKDADDNDDDDSGIIFETPKRLNTRNPPVKVEIEFEQYRRNREYKSECGTL